MYSHLLRRENNMVGKSLYHLGQAFIMIRASYQSDYGRFAPLIGGV